MEGGSSERARCAAFKVQKPLASKEGWLWIRLDHEVISTRHWVKLEWPTMMMGSGPEDASAHDAELPRFCTFRPKIRTRSPSSGNKSTLSHWSNSPRFSSSSKLRERKGDWGGDPGPHTTSSSVLSSSMQSESSFHTEQSRTTSTTPPGSQKKGSQTSQLADSSKSILAIDNRTMVVHTIDASSPAERDEWLSVLRKHAAHHSIRNVYDVSKRKLAQGDISEVYSGKDLLTNKKKALKILLKDQIDDEDEEAVRREVHIAMMLRHPNIIDTSSFVETKASYILVMELLGGGDLMNFMERGRLDYSALPQVVAQILCGLEFVHSQNVCHRDVKPQNILVLAGSSSLVIKIGDFGMACIVSASDSYTKGISNSGKIRCSPGYGAPEIVKREEYGLACDMWSCGVMIYFLLTRMLPFDGGTPEATERLIVEGNYSKLPLIRSDVSEQARQAVAKMLVLDPEDRVTCIEARKLAWLAEIKAPEPEVENGEASVTSKHHVVEVNVLRGRRNVCLPLGCLARLFSERNKVGVGPVGEGS